MKLSKKEAGRQKRKLRIKKKIRGSSDRPRLSIFRSTRYIYAQIIDDDSGKTLCSSSSKEKDLVSQLKSTGNKDAAVLVGKKIAERAKAKNVDRVVFDRNGFIFTGRVKAIADSAREAGLQF